MLYNPTETKQFTWMITTLSSKKNAPSSKSVEHMKAGYGYYMLEEPSAGHDFYVVAFKYFGGETKDSWQQASPEQEKILDKMDSYRYFTPLTMEREKHLTS